MAGSGSLQQLAIVLGIFVALLVDYVLATAAGGSEQDFALGLEAWRWMFLVMTVPALIYGMLELSPSRSRRATSWSRSGSWRRATVLRRRAGQHRRQGKDRRNPAHARARDEALVARPEGPAVGLLPIVWVGIGLSVFQQFVGINVIFYYSSVLWQAVGFSERDSLHHHRDHQRRQYRHHARSRSRGSTRSAASRCCSSGRSA